MKKEKWYIELKAHIESVHRAQNKTILITGPHFYQVVTKPNVLVIKLWIDHINSKLRDEGKDPVKLGWLTLQKQYRRDLETRLNN